MRVRLPPSVIATIESHLLRPDAQSHSQSQFHPVLSLSSILNPSQHSQHSQTGAARALPPRKSSNFKNESNANAEHTSYQYQGQQSHLISCTTPSGRRIIRPSSDPIPLDVERFFRRTGTEHAHLYAAHRFLDDEPFAPCSSSSSSTTSLLRRQTTYSRFITTFLTHPRGLQAVPSLLSRSLSEGVPISTTSLTQILQSVLSSSNSDERKMAVQAILPLLPDQLDIPLLDLLLRAVIRDTSPEPSVIEVMIGDCLKLEGKGREEWPLEVWDVLLASYAQKGDLRGGLSVLVDLRDDFKSRLPQRVQAEEGQGARMGENERKALCQAYTTIVNLWSAEVSNTQSHPGDLRTRVPGGRIGSTIPRQLARDLFDFLSDDGRPEIGFLNAWMRAEKLAENYQAAEAVWRLIQNRSEDHLNRLSALVAHEEKDDGMSDDFNVEQASLCHEPDSHSWSSFFALYASASASSALDLPPLRSSVRRLLVQNALRRHRHRNPLLTTAVTNTILSAIASSSSSESGAGAGGTELDLPLALLVVRQLNTQAQSQSAEPSVDRKTVDLLSSLVFAASRTLTSRDQKELHLFAAKRGATRPSSPAGAGKRRKRWMKFGLGVGEWDVVSECLYRIRMGGVHGAPGAGAGAGAGADASKGEWREGAEGQAEMIHLPLSKPVARLNRSPPASCSSPSSSLHQIATTEQNITSTDEINIHIHSSAPPLAQAIFPALVVLLERTIMALARHHRHRPPLPRPSDSTERQTTKSAEQILGEVMRKVNDEVLPPSRRDRRVAKRLDLV